MTKLRIGVAIITIALAVYVALSPTTVYAPTPRVVLYLLVACLPAILLAAEASAQFSMQLPGFAATAGGAAAVMFMALFLLTRFSKPDAQIAVYQVYDANGNPIVGLDRPGVVEIPTTAGGLTVTKYVDGNTLVLIFPEQVGECELLIRPVSTAPPYVGTLRYAGARESRLILDKNLLVLGATQP